jgi:L-fucose mutarotase/ribose pyranase (RbsD/FucU family)
LIAGHAGKHTTPPSDEWAAEQVCPAAVHGLFPEQATILEVVPLMSIVDWELIMVAEVAADQMLRSSPWKYKESSECKEGRSRKCIWKMSSTFQKEKGKRAKSCVSNCMEKVLFQVIRGVKFRFLKSKKK